MSRTEEISSDVQAVGAAADEARTRAEETLEFARGEIETAYEHGWDGVGQSITITGEALEKVVEELNGSGGTFENATRTLETISEQMSHNEVAEQLALTATELDATHTAIQGTLELVDEAQQGSDQAEHQALSNRLSNLREELEKLAERIAQTRTETESEQELAEKMGLAKQAKDNEGKSRDQDGSADTKKKPENESSKEPAS